MDSKAKVGLTSAIFVAALAALALSRHASITPQVYAEGSEACTDQALEGRYGFNGEGFFTSSNVLPAPIGSFVPLADVGVFVSDGQGKITGSDTISSGGEVIPRTFRGTYNVNSDCTGSTALQFNPGGTVDVAIVLDSRGDEVRALQTNPQGAVFIVLAKKVR